MPELPRIYDHFDKGEQDSGEGKSTPGDHPSARNDLEITVSEDDQFADLDRLYQQALDAMESVEQELNQAGDVLSGTYDEQADAESEQDSIDSSGDGSSQSAMNVAESLTESLTSPQGERGNATRMSALAQSMALASQDSITPESQVTPRQIIEAALFVGGSPLTTKKLVSLLRGNFDPNIVEQAVESLNEQYFAENRPYEIHFGTGGYQMCLREAFASVRSRVFGLGPREVKLSQEALEVLSLVAYNQPISKQSVDKHIRDDAGKLLRQLLRRELIALRRDEGSPKQVSYQTTPRFLQLFGLGDLNELPQAEELTLK